MDWNKTTKTQNNYSDIYDYNKHDKDASGVFIGINKTSELARQRDGRKQMWTPKYLTIPGNVREMLLADIESEKAAISQYNMHIKMINDTYVGAVLARIIKDEEYHIMLLQTLLREL